MLATLSGRDTLLQLKNTIEYRQTGQKRFAVSFFVLSMLKKNLEKVKHFVFNKNFIRIKQSIYNDVSNFLLFAI